MQLKINKENQSMENLYPSLITAVLEETANQNF